MGWMENGWRVGSIIHWARRVSVPAGALLGGLASPAAQRTVFRAGTGVADDRGTDVGLIPSQVLTWSSFAGVSETGLRVP